MVIRNVDSRGRSLQDLKRTNERDDGTIRASEGAWNGNGISSHFERERERDGFRRAGHKSVQVCVRRGNWSGNKAISDFTPVSTKVSSSRSIFEGSPSSIRPSSRYLAKIGEGVERQNPSSNEVGRSYTDFPFSSLFTGMASRRARQSILYPFFLLMSLT